MSKTSQWVFDLQEAGLLPEPDTLEPVYDDAPLDYQAPALSVETLPF